MSRRFVARRSPIHGNGGHANAPAPGAYEPVTGEAVDAAWKKALALRQKHVELLLSNPDAIPSAAPVTPEDGSVKVAAYHMGFGAADQAVERFIEQMADIGRVEGFRAVVRLHEGSEEYLRRELGREEENNTTFVGPSCVAPAIRNPAGSNFTRSPHESASRDCA